MEILWHSGTLLRRNEINTSVVRKLISQSELVSGTCLVSREAATCSNDIDLRCEKTSSALNFGQSKQLKTSSLDHEFNMRVSRFSNPQPIHPKYKSFFELRKFFWQFRIDLRESEHTQLN